MPLTAAVVLCTWNGARFLPAQWASVLAQSRLPDEILVRDDASSDATPALLAALAPEAAARGVAVRILRGEHNLGFVGNFERALDAATGDVLCLCDQDDVWHPDKLASQLAAFERDPRLLLACSDARRIDAAGGVLPRSLFEVLRVRPRELRRIREGNGFGVLLRRNLATGATVALRRGLLAAALPVPAGWIHDEWLAIIAAALGGFACVEAPLVDYRQHDSNQLGMRARGVRDRWRDLRHPPAGFIDALIARDQVLAERLAGLADQVPSGCVALVRDKLAHLAARRAIGGATGRGLARILDETVRGRYRRYGSGWHAALRDFVRSR